MFSKKVEEERLSKVFDMLAYMSTPEGVILGFYGLENDHWVFGEDGKIVAAPQFLERTGGDWNKGAHEGVGYYAGLGIKIAIINDQIAPYDYLFRPDVVESRKNLQGTVINAVLPQDITAPGPIQSKKTAGISQQFTELIVQCFIASSEQECRELIATWPALWATLGGEEISEEKTSIIAGLAQ